MARLSSGTCGDSLPAKRDDAWVGWMHATAALSRPRLALAGIDSGMSPRVPPPRPLVYQLKVTLLGFRPPIWRTLQVESSLTLAQLHEVLQVAFEWWDEHLHQFSAGGLEYGVQEQGRLQEVLDELAYTVAEVLPRVKDTMVYEYDFGDDWRHKIVLEKVLEPDPAARYPRCIKGKRKAPPEDCGGVGGYLYLIDAVAHPERQEHADALEWAGGLFDSEAFNLDEINALLGGG